jgi:putative membrane protein
MAGVSAQPPTRLLTPRMARNNFFHAEGQTFSVLRKTSISNQGGSTMKIRLLTVALSTACLLALLAGLSITQGQTTGGNSNSGQSGNTNRAGMAAGQTSNNADMKFAMTAAQDSMTEVELGRLAVQKGMSDAVKQFGQRMIDDHTNANQQLMQLASTKGMTLPTALDAKHAAMVQKFQAMNGAAFDRAYAKQMVQDHKKAVDLFQKQADRGMDTDLKAFASQTLPVLQGHLSMAQALNGGSTGNSNRGGSSTGMTGGNANGNMGGMGGNMNGNTNSNRGGNMNSNRNMNSGNGNSGTGSANNSNRR